MSVTWQALYVVCIDNEMQVLLTVSTDMRAMRLCHHDGDGPTCYTAAVS